MNPSPYDCPTQDRITKVYNNITGLNKTFGEIWKQMYRGAFESRTGHWVSPPLFDYIPEWFYEQFDIAMTAANRREFAPDIVHFETESLAVNNLRDKYDGDVVFGTPV